MRSVFLLFAALAATPMYAADAGTPDWLIESFFIHKDVPDILSYYGGEMKLYQPNTPSLANYAPEGTATAYRELEATNKRRIYAVDWTLPTGEVINWYAYLDRETEGWKLASIRRFGLPANFRQAYEALKDRPDVTEAEAWSYQNYRLVTTSDAEKKAWFGEHQKTLEQLVTQFGDRTESLGARIGDQKAVLEDETEQTIVDTLYELHLEQIQRDEDGRVRVIFASLSTDSLGLLRLGKGQTIPDRNPRGDYYLEKVADGWYLFKRM